MPIVFVTLSDSYADKCRLHGFEAHTLRIEEYVPRSGRRTYYVSPANSLCFMDGGIDYSLSRILFPDVEPEVKRRVKELAIVSLLGRPYLPIGSSLILDRDAHRSLIVAPTMLLPQNVSGTRNAYFCTMAVLSNILENRKEDINTIDIVFTSLCCGYGKMEEDESVRQILQGIADYKQYCPRCVDRNTVVKEPTLHEQPKLYQNTEFFAIPPAELQH